MYADNSFIFFVQATSENFRLFSNGNDRTTDHTRYYYGHYLIISPLQGHGEVTNENPLILPRTLSIVGALVLLKRRAGKKNASSAFRLNLYITRFEKQ